MRKQLFHDCFAMKAVHGRREFLAAMAYTSILGAFAGVQRAAAKFADGQRHNRLLFTSQGKTALVNADGTGLKYFDFDKPGQASWQPGGTFPDGRRVIFLSMEPRRDGPGRPFDEYYTQTPTHLWIHDLESGSFEEICTKDRLAPFVTPALLLGQQPNTRASRAKQGRPDLQRSTRRDRRPRVHSRRRGASLWPLP